MNTKVDQIINKHLNKMINCLKHYLHKMPNSHFEKEYFCSDVNICHNNNVYQVSTLTTITIQSKRFRPFVIQESTYLKSVLCKVNVDWLKNVSQRRKFID